VRVRGNALFSEPPDLMDFLQTTFLGNDLEKWALSLGLTIVSFLALRLATRVILARIARLASNTETEWDDIIDAALNRTKGLVLLLFAVYIGASPLSLAPRVRSILTSVATIALFFQIGFWLSGGIARWIKAYRDRRAAEDAAGVMSMKVLSIFARLGLWSLVALLSLDNVGVDVTALLAGLGIGGVAVALAAQNILGDLFASLSIVLDKPFVLGDFLIVGDHLGAVEEIGLKTTRVRSLSGEQLVFSNADLLTSRIRNYGRMFERRVAFKIGVTYQTPREALKKIPVILREAVENLGDQVRFDRAHFQAYGDFALTFETVYYVLGPDYNLYMDYQQAINLTIHQRFEEEGIEFAYPTQTLFVVKDSAGEVDRQVSARG
jgi:small-conductance mechanosensitive channel